MKKSLSLLLAMVLVLSAFTAVYAKKGDATTPVVVSEIAAYLSGNFYGHSMTIEGSIYSNNGTVKFNGASDNYVMGNITLNSKQAYILENQYSLPNVYGQVSKIDDTTFDYQAKKIMDTPKIENVVDTFTAGWYPLPEDITKSTHFNKLVVDNVLKIDTSKGDIVLVADTFVMGSSGKVEVIGDGSVALFVGNGFSADGSNVINTKGNSNNFSIIATGDIKIAGGAVVYANLYGQSSSIKLDGSGTLYGNIVSDCKEFSIVGGTTIYGTVYVPLAVSTVAYSAKIFGQLIANSLDISGSAKIVYTKEYADVIVEPIISKYTVTADVSIANAGTISPKIAEVNYNDTVTFEVVANKGYKFVKFASADNTNLPDEKNILKITGDTALTAVFEAVAVEPPVEEVAHPVNDIPTGDRVFINFPYAYLYGYEYGDVGGEDTVKREEAAALLYRLLKQDNKTGDFVPGKSTFTDVDDARWSKNALMYMKHIGVYNKDYVNAHHAITRGEVAKIIVFALRIQPDASKTIRFSDLADDDANYWYLKALSDIGIMVGYDKKINPNGIITRAEYITMVNRLLGRDAEYNIADQKSIYPDLVDKNYWAYDDLMRASFGFTDDKVDGAYQIDPSRKPAREKIDYN